MAAAASAPIKTQECCRDVEAETAALSLARRRGKCSPSVDTKLADAWLGFYVALTKTPARPTEAATQASTEAVTEGCSSDVASSPGLSPRGAASEPLTAGTLGGESWADASEEPTSTKKRSRRSHRRRRTRGRGKKGRSSLDNPEDDCAPIDEEEDDGFGPTPCGSPMAASPGVMSTSLSTPGCAQALLPAECFPDSSPSKAFKGPMGMLTGTSPHAVLTPSHCEASARTPPQMAFGSSPMACMLPSTPSAFTGPIYQGGHASFQGSTMILASPGNVFMSSPFHAPAVQAPTFFGPGTSLPPPPAHCPMSAELCATPMANPTEQAWRLWLAGGLPTNDADLAIRLQAALPETYED